MTFAHAKTPGSIDNLVKKHVLLTILDNDGSLLRAVPKLSIPRATLYRWFRIWGLDKTDSERMRWSERKQRVERIRLALQELP